MDWLYVYTCLCVLLPIHDSGGGTENAGYRKMTKQTAGLEKRQDRTKGRRVPARLFRPVLSFFQSGYLISHFFQSCTLHCWWLAAPLIHPAAAAAAVAPADDDDDAFAGQSAKRSPTISRAAPAPSRCPLSFSWLGARKKTGVRTRQRQATNSE